MQMKFQDSSLGLCEVQLADEIIKEGWTYSQNGAWLSKVCGLAMKWLSLPPFFHLRRSHLQCASDVFRVDGPLTDGTVLCLIRSGPSRLVSVFTDFSKTFTLHQAACCVFLSKSRA
jgi:hypothetical protein